MYINTILGGQIIKYMPSARYKLTQMKPNIMNIDGKLRILQVLFRHTLTDVNGKKIDCDNIVPFNKPTITRAYSLGVCLHHFL